MRWHASTLLLVAVLAGCAGRQDAPAPSARPDAGPLDSARAHGDAALKAAIDAASRGELTDAQRAAVRNHPAQAWVEYARLRRDIGTLALPEADAFLAAHENDEVGRSFREDWLAALFRREQWQAFLTHWRPSIERASLRCMALTAQSRAGRDDAQWAQAVRSAWLSGKPTPADCAPAIEAWQTQNGLDDALRWQRIDLAIAENHAGVVRDVAAGLPAADRTRALAYADALAGQLDDSAANWPRDARSRAVATAALVAIAKKSPSNGEIALAKFSPMLSLDETQRGRVLSEIALQSAASYEPEAARRLAAVPESAYDERLSTLRIREAMARRDWAGALAAIGKLPSDLRESAQWRYFRARLTEMTGGGDARALYAQAATAPEFHGFLAADRIAAPYPLCPWMPQPQPALQQQVASTPALQRALALYRIGRKDWAMREWNDALAGFDDAHRQLAVALAQDSGWFDRAVFNLARENRDELRLYTLRFPLHHVDTIRREAKRNGLDPAWIAAEIRAESVYDPNARSQANAMGLMQVLPATGQATAQKAGIPWNGADSLYDPDTNIAIGSAYLREMHERWGDLPHAIAAYNAGPTPTERWRTQRPDFDPDLWIETISYKETREYVARVLAFSVLYDWRMNGDALRVSDRIAGKVDGQRTRFACPNPVSAKR